MTAPLISVVMPSYNHAPFVKAAIRSVLGQSFADLELIVVDDGSSDGSQQLIASETDPRLRHHFLEQNRGACEAMNVGIGMARGRLVAVCNSDDEWQPERLARQLPVIENNASIGAVFAEAEWIDAHGHVTTNPALGPNQDVFRQPNRSRWAWFRNLFEAGNRLCHPSVLIRREIYDRVGPYDNRLRQLPDFDMWLRVLRETEIFVCDQKLVRFRVHETNTSQQSLDNLRRNSNELQLILERNFLSLSASQFIDAFGSRKAFIDDDVRLRIEKALYLLGTPSRSYRLLLRNMGLRLLFELLGEPAAVERLQCDYGLSVHDLHREMAFSGFDLVSNERNLADHVPPSMRPPVNTPPPPARPTESKKPRKRKAAAKKPRMGKALGTSNRRRSRKPKKKESRLSALLRPISRSR